MRKILLFIAACALPFALLAGENEPKTDENIFELHISKMPPIILNTKSRFLKRCKSTATLPFYSAESSRKKMTRAGFITNLAAGMS